MTHFLGDIDITQEMCHCRPTFKCEDAINANANFFLIRNCTGVSGCPSLGFQGFPAIVS